MKNYPKINTAKLISEDKKSEEWLDIIFRGEHPDKRTDKQWIKWMNRTHKTNWKVPGEVVERKIYQRHRFHPRQYNKPIFTLIDEILAN